MHKPISIVVAVSRNGIIGRDQGLPWRLRNDLMRFKRTTIGHSLIMGRKTFESIGKCLPGRKTIVITRQRSLEIKDVTIANSLNDAIARSGKDRIPFIVGGGEIYQTAMTLVEHIYLTRVLANIDGDTTFHFDCNDGWQCDIREFTPADSQNDFPTIFERWRKT